MKHEKILIRLSVLLNICFIVFFIWKIIDRKIVEKEHICRYNNKMEEYYDSLSIDSNDIVLVGNSLTRRFPFEILTNTHIINRGIDGNTCQQVLGRITSINMKHPKRILLEIGINDLLRDKVSVDSLFTSYKELAFKIRRETPQTKLCIQSLLPVAKESDVNSKITKINQRLLIFCQNNNIEYIDLFPLFLKSGRMNSALSYDGLHLNIQGYKVWKSKINNYLQ